MRLLWQSLRRLLMVEMHGILLRKSLKTVIGTNLLNFEITSTTRFRGFVILNQQIRANFLSPQRTGIGAASIPVFKTDTLLTCLQFSNVTSQESKLKMRNRFRTGFIKERLRHVRKPITDTLDGYFQN